MPLVEVTARNGRGTWLIKVERPWRGSFPNDVTWRGHEYERIVGAGDPENPVYQHMGPVKSDT